MATLKEPVKIFIVQSLACRDTPQEVADAVKQEFGIEIGRQQVAAYDPTKVRGKDLSQKFVDLLIKLEKNLTRALLISLSLINSIAFVKSRRCMRRQVKRSVKTKSN